MFFVIPSPDINHTFHTSGDEDEGDEGSPTASPTDSPTEGPDVGDESGGSGGDENPDVGDEYGGGAGDDSSCTCSAWDNPGDCGTDGMIFRLGVS